MKRTLITWLVRLGHPRATVPVVMAVMAIALVATGAVIGGHAALEEGASIESVEHNLTTAEQNVTSDLRDEGVYKPPIPWAVAGSFATADLGVQLGYRHPGVAQVLGAIVPLTMNGLIALHFIGMAVRVKRRV